MWRRRPASRPRPRARGGLPGLVALVALLGVAGCAREAATPEGALSLAGRQPFRAGDDPGGDGLLYTYDAADDLLWVDLGGRRILKKQQQ